MSEQPQAGSILREAATTIDGRAAQRDSEKERSMARCVAAFNGLTKHNLTEEEGWMFMVVLKMARALNGSKFVKDDYVDGAAYMALAGESAGADTRPYAAVAVDYASMLKDTVTLAHKRLITLGCDAAVAATIYRELIGEEPPQQ